MLEVGKDFNCMFSFFVLDQPLHSSFLSPFTLGLFRQRQCHRTSPLVDDPSVVAQVEMNSVNFTLFQTPLLSSLLPAGPQSPSLFVLLFKFALYSPYM